MTEAPNSVGGPRLQFCILPTSLLRQTADSEAPQCPIAFFEPATLWRVPESWASSQGSVPLRLAPWLPLMEADVGALGPAGPAETGRERQQLQASGGGRARTTTSVQGAADGEMSRWMADPDPRMCKSWGQGQCCLLHVTDYVLHGPLLVPAAATDTSRGGGHVRRRCACRTRHVARRYRHPAAR